MDKQIQGKRAKQLQSEFLYFYQAIWKMNIPRLYIPMAKSQEICETERFLIPTIRSIVTSVNETLQECDLQFVDAVHLQKIHAGIDAFRLSMRRNPWDFR